MRQGIGTALMALALTGCGQAGDEAAGVQEAAYEATADLAEGAEVSDPTAQTAIAVSMPRIAYVYDYGFRLPAKAIIPLQQRHADLCEAQGPQTCRIVDMRQSGTEGDYAHGSLSLSVAAPKARSFGAMLTAAAEGAGGEQMSSAISGEDLSKRIVDTQARLRARTVLRDRLMEVLKTRRGTVAELVEAERSVAQVNEEIDQAQSWLAEMQGRVEFSRINISYGSGAPSGGGFTAPIRAAFGNIASILGVLIAAVITGLTVLLPLGLFGWLLWLGVTAVKRRAIEGSKPTDPC